MPPEEKYEDATDLLPRKCASICGEALREHEMAINLDQDNIDFKLNKGSVMEYLGDLTKSDYRYLYRRYFKSGRLCREAVDECNRVPSKCYSRDAHIIKGNILYSLGWYEECLKRCNAMLHENQEDKEVFTLKGVSPEKLNRSEEALVNFDRIISRRPGNSDVYNLNAGVLFSLKRYEESLAERDSAISLSPDNYIAHGNKANAPSELHRSEEALEEYDKALQIAEYNAEIRRNKIFALRRVSMEEADRELNDGTRLNRSIVFKP